MPDLSCETHCKYNAFTICFLVISQFVGCWPEDGATEFKFKKTNTTTFPPPAVALPLLMPREVQSVKGNTLNMCDDSSPTTLSSQMVRN